MYILWYSYFFKKILWVQKSQFCYQNKLDEQKNDITKEQVNILQSKILCVCWLDFYSTYLVTMWHWSTDICFFLFFFFFDAVGIGIVYLISVSDNLLSLYKMQLIFVYWFCVLQPYWIHLLVVFKIYWFIYFCCFLHRLSVVAASGCYSSSLQCKGSPVGSLLLWTTGSRAWAP